MIADIPTGHLPMCLRNLALECAARRSRYVWLCNFDSTAARFHRHAEPPPRTNRWQRCFFSPTLVHAAVIVLMSAHFWANLI